ncbi:MAG: M28 family peptidase [Candidatus Kapabacteria bacterium]|nr:M28 family peptidase [Candidatus Kapabacteria bacterium]
MKLYNMNTKISIFAILILMTVQNAVCQFTPSKDRMRDAVKYLAGDELKGRFPGTEGMEKAAAFIIDQYKAAGVKSWGDSYKQEFSVTTALEAGTGNNVVFETVIQRPGIPKEKLPRAKQNWIMKNDFVPLAFSDNGTVTGELAFVGFGISAPELKYDDYEGIDVKDKIVIFISDNPDMAKKDSPFNQYSSLRYKATNARNKGAIGIIMVKIQGDSMNVFERLDYVNIGKNSGIKAIQAWRQSLSKFFPKKQSLIESETIIVNTKKPNSFILPNCYVNITVDLKDITSTTSNINGYIAGTDPSLKDEYIVVGAHYDHLGYGGPTSMSTSTGKPQIHNGADDNASGVAALLELAYKIAGSPLKRTVIFSTFSGEEMGLLGSSYFVNNPPVPLENIVTMINLDMVGRMNKNELTVFGTATSAIFPAMIDSLDLIDSLSITKASDAYGPSDHASFVTKNIPVLMFFTGLHEDYHKPSDDWDHLNYPGMEMTAGFIYSTLETIANKAEKLTFQKPDIEAPKRRTDREQGYGELWFGIIPNFEESKLGCKISGSSPGSPADKAGLIADDIIVKIDDSDIKNLYDFMYKIKGHKAGDVLNVHVLRGKDYSEKVEMKVTLVPKVK